MQWSDIDFSPSRSKLRRFAGLWLAFFLAIALWQAYGHHRPLVAAVCAALALTLGPLGLAFPRAMGPIFVSWTVLVFPLGWILSNLMLALLFYGLFTPLALVFRLIQRDALELRRRPSAPSYWASKPMSADPAGYLRQF